MGNMQGYKDFVEGNLSPTALSQSEFIKALDRMKEDDSSVLPSLLIMGSMGLCGESGEVIEHVKKLLFHGHTYDDTKKEKLIKELGDVMFYVFGILIAIDVDMNVVIDNNVKKLNERHPQGFTAKGAHND